MDLEITASLRRALERAVAETCDARHEVWAQEATRGTAAGTRGQGVACLWLDARGPQLA